VLRGALGSDHLRIVLRRLGHIRHAAVVIAWWLGLAGLALVGCPWWVMAALVAAPLAFWRGGAITAAGGFQLSAMADNGAGPARRSAAPPRRPAPAFGGGGSFARLARA
jgi:hypothetical protein